MNCLIRKWELTDAMALAEALNNKNIQNNLRDGLPYPYTENDASAFIQTILQENQDSTFAFAIIYNGNVVGSIAVFRQTNIHHLTAEMGYFIAEPYWGKGLGTMAIKLVCDYIFSNTNIIRIYAEPFAYNTASCKILEKSGFLYEGTLRSNAVKNNQVIDMKMYSLIKPT